MSKWEEWFLSDYFLVAFISFMVSFIIGILIWGAIAGNRFEDKCHERGGNVKDLYGSSLCLSPDGRILDSQ